MLMPMELMEQCPYCLSNSVTGPARHPNRVSKSYFSPLPRCGASRVYHMGDWGGAFAICEQKEEEDGDHEEEALRRKKTRSRINARSRRFLVATPLMVLSRAGRKTKTSADATTPFDRRVGMRRYKEKMQKY